MKIKILAQLLLVLTPLVSIKVFSETPWLDKKYVESKMKLWHQSRATVLPSGV